MLGILDRQLDVRLVILDKDGTLLAFDVMWHAWFANLMQALAEQRPLAETTLDGLAATLGYDRATGAWDPQGPLTVAPIDEVLVIMGGQLYTHERLSYDDALARVREALRSSQEQTRVEDLAQPMGDLRGWLERVRTSGALLALATADQRAETERALRHLGVLDLFATTVCGDDGVPLKPAPDMALEICRRTGVPPDQTIMVGDTVADLQMARAAGLLCGVGVTTGAAPASLLAPYADVLVTDIHAIEPLANHEQARTP